MQTKKKESEETALRMGSAIHRPVGRIAGGVRRIGKSADRKAGKQKGMRFYGRFLRSDDFLMQNAATLCITPALFFPREMRFCNALQNSEKSLRYSCFASREAARRSAVSSNR